MQTRRPVAVSYSLPVDAYVLPLEGGEHFALVSAQDFERCAGLRWFAVCPSGSGDARYLYAYGNEPATRRPPVALHRFVLGLQPGDGTIADHINGDTLDCRRSNLRAGDYVQNNNNRYHGRTGEDMPAWRRRIASRATAYVRPVAPVPAVDELQAEPAPFDTAIYVPPAPGRGNRVNGRVSSLDDYETPETLPLPRGLHSWTPGAFIARALRTLDEREAACARLDERGEVAIARRIARETRRMRKDLDLFVQQQALHTAPADVAGQFSLSLAA